MNKDKEDIHSPPSKIKRIAAKTITQNLKRSNSNSKLSYYSLIVICFILNKNSGIFKVFNIYIK